MDLIRDLGLGNFRPALHGPKQRFQLFNLDKSQAYTAHEWLEHAFCGGSSCILHHLLHEDPEFNWAGDRLIYLGSGMDSYDIPEGLRTFLHDCKEVPGTDLKHFSECSCKSTLTTEKRRVSRRCDIDESQYVLRNLSKSEFVRGNGLCVRQGDQGIFEDEDETSHTPSLADVALMRITWSSLMESTDYIPRWPGSVPITRGPWAGDRVDIVKKGFNRQGKEWTDVSEKATREIFEVWRHVVSPRLGSSCSRDRTVLSPPTMAKPFPALPNELVSTILQFFADGCKMDALSLMQVATWTEGIAIPALYRNVIVDNRQVLRLRPSLSTARRKSGLESVDTEVGRVYGSHVRSLYAPCFPMEVARSCPDLRILFTGDLSSVTKHSQLVEAKHLATPWCIMFTFRIGFTNLPSKPHPLFSRVTHLCVNAADLPVLAVTTSEAIPCLTHLAVNYPNKAIECKQWNRRRDPLEKHPLYGAICAILESPSFPRLVCFLLISDTRQNVPFSHPTWPAIIEIQDDRLFARVELEEREYVAVIYGGTTIWDNASVRYKDWRELVRKTSRWRSGAGI